MRIYPYWIIFIFFVCIPFAASAQSFDASFSISASPSNPQPEQSVTLTVEGFAFDLDRTRIRWFESGVLIKNAIGGKTITVVSPNIGKKNTYEALIETPQGGTVSTSYTLAPSNVLLLVEGKTYTPPFYKGRALPSHSSTVTITAFPNFGTSVNKDSLLYEWREDGVVLGSKSGAGKSTLTLTGTRPLSTVLIEVSVSNTANTLFARGDLLLAPQDPEIYVYKESPILGIMLEKAESESFELSDPEVNLMAYPYFFSGTNRLANNLAYTWTLNGSPVSSGEKGGITLRKEGNQSGQATVGISIRNTREILQSAKKQLTISFASE